MSEKTQIKNITNREKVLHLLKEKEYISIEKIKAKGPDINNLSSVLVQLHQRKLIKRIIKDRISHYCLAFSHVKRIAILKKKGKQQRTAHAKNLSSDLISFFKKHRKKSYSVKEVKAISNSSGSYSAILANLNKLVDKNILTKVKTGKSFRYTFSGTLPVLANNEKDDTSLDVQPMIKQQSVITPAISEYTQQVQIMDSQPVSLGALIDQVQSMQALNAMYKQGFETIAHVLEQVNIIESD